jgi:hypothetical protein
MHCASSTKRSATYDHGRKAGDQSRIIHRDELTSTAKLKGPVKTAETGQR